MKRSNRLVILIGVLLAIVAFVAIVVLLQGTGGPGPVQQPTTVTVLVALQDIEIGDPVTPELVEAREVDPAAVSGTRFADPSQLIGRPALIPVPEGGQVSQEVVGGATTVCISCQLLPGEKAIAFQVDRITGLDFLLQSGDHIDIVYRASITALQRSPESTDEFVQLEPIVGLDQQPSVKVLLQDKRVLYVSASRIQQLTQGTPSASPTPGGAPQQIETVVIVFAGTDADAEVIKFAQSDQSVIGPLTAILRGTEDTNIEVTEGVTLQLLVERFGIPIPGLINVELPTPTP